jgi:hypothetical protein
LFFLGCRPRALIGQCVSAPNRGSTNALTILNSAKTANTKTAAPDPGNGFLMNEAYAICLENQVRN